MILQVAAGILIAAAVLSIIAFGVMMMGQMDSNGVWSESGWRWGCAAVLVGVVAGLTVISMAAT